MADNVAIGITLPISKGKTGYFAQSFNVIDQVKSNLINLLLTKKGERIMQPDFGCNLHSLLFTQMNTDYTSQVKKAIESAVTSWLPYLNINDIIVNKDDARNRTDVQVTFSLKSNVSITDSIVVTF